MAEQTGENFMLVSLAVQAILITLQQKSVPFAFTGNVARSVYGETLPPSEEIDVLVLSREIDISRLKPTLAQNHPTLFSYDLPTHTLHYCNPALAAQNARRSEIEINFTTSSLDPGAHHCAVDGVPLVPYSVLLLQQLLVWDKTSPTLENTKAARGADILRMLKVFRKREGFQHQPLFDRRLQTASKERVARFFEVHPSYRKEWQRLGLMPHRLRVMHATVLAAKDGRDGEPRSVLIQGNRTSPSQTLAERPLLQDGNLSKPPPTTVSTPLPSSKPHPGKTDTSDLSPDVTPVPTKPKKLTRVQIRRVAAHTAVDILQAHGFPSAIFGSMACKLYGNGRIPNDVDLLVLPPPAHTLEGLPPTQETLKDLLVASAPSQFVLKPARDPDATYRVLWFLPTPNAKPTPHKATKVDILLPGVMHLPALSMARVFWRGPDPETRLPVLPFSVLLLQKLQGWDDHRKAEEERYLAKVDVDVTDLEWMLGMGVGRYMENRRRGREGVWNDRTMFGEEFEDLSRARVLAFCEAYPKWTDVWRGLGFAVP